MYAFFNFLTRLTDVILYPFRNLPPFWGIVFLALLTAIFILLIYKFASNQKAIKTLKKRIQGHFLGIYLSRDDAGQILKTQAKLLGSILRYLGHSVRPLLVIIIPVLLLCVQMQLRYGYRKLKPGDEVTVSLKLASEALLLQSKIELETPPGVSLQTPPLRIGALNEVDWRIKVLEEGNHQLKFSVNGRTITKILPTAPPSIERIYPETERASFASIIKYPGEKLLKKAGPVLSLRINYPARNIKVLGLKLHWAVVYFALAIIFGLFLKRPLKVDF